MNQEISNMSLGFIAITHYQLGNEVSKIIRSITHEKLPMITIGIDPDEDPKKNKALIHKAITGFKRKNGIIILSDFYGATPSNLCQEFLQKGKIEMITGCNMPIVLKATTLKKFSSVSDAVIYLRDYGKFNIRNHPSDS